MRKEWISGVLAGVLAIGLWNQSIILQAQEKEVWVSDEDLHGKTNPPEADAVLPDANQLRYQKEELAAFCHFGPNTFNEIEWGEHYGSRSPGEIFTLRKDFDAETLVKTLKEAGFKKLIVTAKHHDGFCLWDSRYTDYDVRSSGYIDSNGQSDILAEISAACTKEGLDMGLYLSPWDIHEPSYGYKDEDGNPTTPDKDALDYNDFYNNQLEEILSNPIYGNDGKFVEVWMDGAKGSGANAQEYDFQRWFDTIQKYEGKAAGRDADCLLFGAQAYTTVRWIGNELGIAGKDTWSKSKVDITNNSIDSNQQGSFTVGFEDGNKWTVPEADARITSGWFWGTQKNTPKSMEELSNMYFESVGHNATLLLNVPPNTEGSIDDAIVRRIQEFGDNIKKTFATNLIQQEGATVQVSSVRGQAENFKPANMIDNNDDTYWTTDDGVNEAKILIDLGKRKNFDVVSIEEAIANGQRIHGYKVEYREGTSDEWKLLEEGQTIGAKRLCRTNEVTARQVKITVKTPEGKVPMISEIGIFKATDSMKKANPIPSGMDVIDVSNRDISDQKGFVFKNGWHDETGRLFINGTNVWANAGAEMELQFLGTKAYLFGTLDPNHGTAKIRVDQGPWVTIDTNASKRLTGQKIFETETLEDGMHTLKMQVLNKAIGIEAAASINNGGVGMIELENDSYSMHEDETKSLKIKRVGGTKGEIRARLQPNPGTAIQDDYDTTLISDIVFKEGQTEAFADVKTRRNTNKTNDQYFTVELTDVSDGAILGFNKTANITIFDIENSQGVLEALVDECEELKKEWFLSGWKEFEETLHQAQVILEKEDRDLEECSKIESLLRDKKEQLIRREHYTVEDPFIFPEDVDTNVLLEAEFADLHNTGDPDETWTLMVSQANWASNQNFINCLNQGDLITIPYDVKVAGIYKVTLQYRSGSLDNTLAWMDDMKHIVPGSISAGNDDASVTKTVSFDLEVESPGTGILTFKGDTKDAPQLDKMDIRLFKKANEESMPVNKSELSTLLDKAKTHISKADDYTIESITALQKAMENAQTILDKEASTQEQVNDAVVLLQNSLNNLQIRDYTVYVIKNVEGEQIPVETLQIKKGESQNIVFPIIDGYKMTDVRVNDDSIGIQNQYTIDAIHQDYHIEIIYEKKTNIDKSILKDTLDKTNLDKESIYTKDSVFALTSAKEKALAVYNDEASTQQDIDKMVELLQKALDGLQTREESNDSSSAIQNEIGEKYNDSLNTKQSETSDNSRIRHNMNQKTLKSKSLKRQKSVNTQYKSMKMIYMMSCILAAIVSLVTYKMYEKYKK